MPDITTPHLTIMAVLEQFEATEANLIKLERLWEELSAMIPPGVAFGENVEYEDRARSFDRLLASIPKIDGWRPNAAAPDLDDVAQSRFDAAEIMEPAAQMQVERSIEEPGRQLREYRFRLDNKRKALIRDALVGLIDQIDEDVRTVRAVAGHDAEGHVRLDPTVFDPMREHMKQVEVLLGSTVKKPAGWTNMMRHMHFGHVGDLHDIEKADWPAVKAGLRSTLYGVDEPLPVEADDLGALVAARPAGPVTTALQWSSLNDEGFERLIFTLISDAPGYENAEWLMQTRAPDRGRDLSVTRVIRDELSGTIRLRVVIQCKHWTSRSVNAREAAAAKDQMALWANPRVDVLVIATSGRFTADAVAWKEAHDASGALPRVELWAESHLERLLAERPAIIAEFRLRGH